MALETALRILLPALLLCFAAVDVLWPLARLRRTTGSWGVPIATDRNPGERAIALAIALILAALGLGTARFARGGAAAVGASVPPPGVAGAGLALLVAGIAVVAVAQRQMGASLRVGLPPEPTALVRRGLYRWTRNPIYLGMLLSLAGVALVAPGPGSISVWLATAVLIGVQTRLEERHLTERHGEAYLAYAARVGRFVPGVGRLRAAERRWPAPDPDDGGSRP
jgi:protein-S-isoprenylcysteine O-methyltransferase Ste14